MNIELEVVLANFIKTVHGVNYSLCRQFALELINRKEITMHTQMKDIIMKVATAQICENCGYLRIDNDIITLNQGNICETCSQEKE